MSRTYSKRTCPACNELVSASGGAFAAHMKKHLKSQDPQERKKARAHFEYQEFLRSRGLAR